MPRQSVLYMTFIGTNKTSIDQSSPETKASNEQSVLQSRPGVYLGKQKNQISPCALSHRTPKAPHCFVLPPIPPRTLHAHMHSRTGAVPRAQTMLSCCWCKAPTATMRLRDRHSRGKPNDRPETKSDKKQVYIVQEAYLDLAARFSVAGPSLARAFLQMSSANKSSSGKRITIMARPVMPAPVCTVLYTLGLSFSRGRGCYILALHRRARARDPFP